MSTRTPGTNTQIGGGGFHHVAMRCRDFDKSVKFYSAVLGCEPRITWGETPDRGALLDCGDGNYIELFERPDLPPFSDNGAIFHFALRTTDTDAATARVRSAGFEITMEPKEINIPGRPFDVPAKISFFKGPDGESVEFFQNDLT
jgi:glyoxylase I family protein